METLESLEWPEDLGAGEEGGEEAAASAGSAMAVEEEGSGSEEKASDGTDSASRDSLPASIAEEAIGSAVQRWVARVSGSAAGSSGGEDVTSLSTVCG